MENEKIKINIQDISISFNNEVRYFREYLDFNNVMFLDRKKLLDKWLVEDIIENPNDESVLRAMYAYDKKKTPSFFYHSSIISIFSLLEFTLNRICERIIEDTKILLSLDDFSGSNIVNKARKFLLKIAKLNLTKLDKYWIPITKYQKIRNLIVHNNCNILIENLNNISESKDFILLSEFKGIEIDKESGYFIIIHQSVLDKFLDSVENFVQGILEILKNKDFRTFGINYEEELDELPF